MNSEPLSAATAVSTAVSTATAAITPITQIDTTREDRARRARIMTTLREGGRIASSDVRDGECYTRLTHALTLALATAQRMTAAQYRFCLVVLAHSVGLGSEYVLRDRNDLDAPTLADYSAWLGGVSVQSISRTRAELLDAHVLYYVDDDPERLALNAEWERWDQTLFARIGADGTRASASTARHDKRLARARSAAINEHVNSKRSDDINEHVKAHGAAFNEYVKDRVPPFNEHVNKSGGRSYLYQERERQEAHALSRDAQSSSSSQSSVSMPQSAAPTAASTAAPSVPQTDTRADVVERTERAESVPSTADTREPMPSTAARAARVSQPSQSQPQPRTSKKAQLAQQMQQTLLAARDTTSASTTQPSAPTSTLLDRLPAEVRDLVETLRSIDGWRTHDKLDQTLVERLLPHYPSESEHDYPVRFLLDRALDYHLWCLSADDRKPTHNGFLSFVESPTSRKKLADYRQRQRESAREQQQRKAARVSSGTQIESERERAERAARILQDAERARESTRSASRNMPRQPRAR